MPDIESDYNTVSYALAKQKRELFEYVAIAAVFGISLLDLFLPDTVFPVNSFVLILLVSLLYALVYASPAIRSRNFGNTGLRREITRHEMSARELDEERCSEPGCSPYGYDDVIVTSRYRVAEIADIEVYRRKEGERVECEAHTDETVEEPVSEKELA